jgi:hypothetical protein
MHTSTLVIAAALLALGAIPAFAAGARPALAMRRKVKKASTKF